MDEKAFESINVVPFIDVMLVLLTMVLTTASFVATGRIPVALPQAGHAQVEKKKDKTIDLTTDGGVRFDGESMSKEELERRLAGLPSDTQLLVRADRAIVFQAFVDVAELLKRLKFTRVALQTRAAAR
ncbi:biopolymer transporter ExbD [Methylosinus sp. Sm6]|uniref:ExbD/TolR family protein n=1 Tax=Methylosinus sp. Sm6 TaxID=2866948 RepID=UPI001C98EA38|nr:biopolymer transporter ExbD [Methylosinus sp. Sm6]